MSTVTTYFTKFQMVAAACAIAAAAVLTPAAVAAAKPDLMPTTPLTHMFDTGPIFGPISFSQSSPWWWLGNSPDPNGTTTAVILSFQPLALLPGFIQPLLGFFKGINLDVCVAGLSARIGPYGTVSVKEGTC
jgi:hypothetical protein